MFEFSMVFPIFLTVILLFIQWVLLLNARVIVNYAAFCAARSAVVWIPAGEDVAPGEPSNTVGAPEQSKKLEHIRGAAAFACLPVSPRIFAFFGDISKDLLIRLLRPEDPYRTNPFLRVKPANQNAQAGLLNELSQRAKDEFINPALASLVPKQARFEHDRGRRSFSQLLAIFPTLIVAH